MFFLLLSPMLVWEQEEVGSVSLWWKSIVPGHGRKEGVSSCLKDNVLCLSDHPLPAGTHR